MNIEHYRQTLERKKGQKEQIEKSIQSSKLKLKKLTRLSRNLEKAQVIIQQVAQATQQELEYHISEMVTLALEAVFPNPYEFQVEFVLKRGKSEAELYFSRDGNRIHPTMASGIGAVDVASFALRPSLWSLKHPKTRNVLILDEPFKNLNDPGRKLGLHRKAAEMVKMISEKLDLQIIMVTLNEELIDVADKVFRTKLVKGISKIEEG